MFLDRVMFCNPIGECYPFHANVTRLRKSAILFTAIIEIIICSFFIYTIYIMTGYVQMDQVCTEVLYRCLYIPSLDSLLRTRCLRWYGHVCMIASAVLWSLVWPDGGRSKKIWSQTVTDDMLCQFIMLTFSTG